MKLSEWLKKVGWTQEQLGRKIGLTQGRISQICLHGTGELRTAMAIEEITDSEVTLAELLPAKPVSASSPEAA